MPKATGVPFFLGSPIESDILPFAMRMILALRNNPHPQRIQANFASKGRNLGRQIFRYPQVAEADPLGKAQSSNYVSGQLSKACRGSAARAEGHLREHAPHALPSRAQRSGGTPGPAGAGAADRAGSGCRAGADHEPRYAATFPADGAACALSSLLGAQKPDSLIP